MTGRRARLGLAALLVVALAVAVPLGRWERGHAAGDAAAGIQRVRAAVGSDLAGPSVSAIAGFRGLRCLVYASGGYAYARELCVDGAGAAVAATDATGSADPRVWDLTRLPGHAPFRIPEAVFTAAQRRIDRRAVGADAARGLQAAVARCFRLAGAGGAAAASACAAAARELDRLAAWLGPWDAVAGAAARDEAGAVRRLVAALAADGDRGAALAAARAAATRSAAAVARLAR